jgi:hypothetical protein
MRNAIFWTVLAISGVTAPGRADVIFDQINPGFTSVVANQEASGSAFTVRFVDDFTINRAASLQSVTIDLGGFTSTATNAPRFTSFANIGVWRVNIWSSEALTRSNFFGDLFRATLLPSDATYLGGMPTIPAGGLAPGQTQRVLVTLPLVTELDPGTYWLGVTPLMSFTHGQVGIVQGDTGNSLQINNAGGFGFSGGVLERGTSAAYRLEGTLAGAGGGTAAGAVPEPASWAMLIAGFGLIGASLRRRRVGPRLTRPA